MSWRISMAGVLFAASSALAGAADKPASAQQGAAPTVVITGANRGIGLEFARQYAARGWNVIATARRPDSGDDLGKLAAANPRVKVEQVDVADVASVDAFAARLKGVSVDVLVNNAGVFGETKDVMGGKFSLGTIDFSQFDKFFRTNALGPLKVTEALLPNLRAGQQKKVLAVTSLAGSFDYTLSTPQMPGHYFYKGSKAALDMFILTMANDTKKEGLIVAALSPGQVDTRNAGLKKMGMPGIVEIDQSVGGMIKVIDGLQAKDSGGYFRWSGEPTKW